MQLEKRCRDLVGELALGDPDDIREVVPLTGGVASDIAMVRLRERKICAKFALPKLKVAADWYAPVHRNAAEYAWLEVASHILPNNAVKLYGRSETANGFAMEYLEGDDVYLWKDNLLSEAPDAGEAPKIGELIGKLHSVSAQSAFDRSLFHNRGDFQALRIEPYLTHTRLAYPELCANILPIEKMLFESDMVLVHGDASPKNILFRNGAPIMLDAECATMGDACFDPAFCLNHLVLKAIHLPGSRGQLLKQVNAFWEAYAGLVDWEDPEALETRVCALLPVLMLARVDGKSPVEYLSETGQQTVRDLSVPLITSPAKHIADFVEHLADHLKGETV